MHYNLNPSTKPNNNLARIYTLVSTIRCFVFSKFLYLLHVFFNLHLTILQRLQYADIYCNLFNTVKNTFLNWKNLGTTHKLRQMYWGAAKGRTLSPPWLVRWSPLLLGQRALRNETDFFVLQFEAFILSGGPCWETGRHRQLFECSKSTRPSCVWRDKGKRV